MARYEVLDQTTEVVSRTGVPLLGLGSSGILDTDTTVTVIMNIKYHMDRHGLLAERIGNTELL